MKLILSILGVACVSNGLFAAELQFHEIIVSHADANNILHLYHIKEGGSSRRKITNSNHGCMMPAVSPDGSKIVYVQQNGKGMALWISEFDGKNSKALTESGRNMNNQLNMYDGTGGGWQRIGEGGLYRTK